MLCLSELIDQNNNSDPRHNREP